jgi:hypothetical protein
VVGLVVLAGSACGGPATTKAASSPGDVILDRADEHLRDLRSATIDFRFSGSTAPAEGGERRPTVGFRIQGPFSFDSEGDLPVADLDYTRLTGGTAEETGFVSTGAAAFLHQDGKTYAVPAERLAGLTLGDGKGGAGLHELRLAAWVEDAAVARDGDTDVITGRLRADAAFADLASLAAQLGLPDTADLDRLGRQDRERLARMIESSSIRVVVGHEDGALRSLEATVDLAAAVDATARRALGSLAGARIELALALSGVDRPVHVEAPPGAKPLP